MIEAANSQARIRSNVNLSPGDIQRFFEVVNKSGPIPSHRPDLGPCWIWTMVYAGQKYGRFSIRGRLVSAHVVSWIITNGDNRENRFVLHKCDVRTCVNPSHLFLGTHKENMKDMVQKGRQATGVRHMSVTHPEALRRGSENGNSKLSEEKVIDIREKYKTGKFRQVDLAHEFGVNQTLIGFIVRREIWTHVP